MSPVYSPHRAARNSQLAVRGLRYHLLQWGGPELVTPAQPPLLMLHGWMDVGASFQFLVDALAAAEGASRWVIAPDWRGFGLTQTPGADSYWFPDYLGDLEAMLRALDISGPVDLLGHSMGGNVAMSYAGVRPQRVRRLVNLEGFGMPATQPHQAPARLAQWLDELAAPAALRGYADLEAVAARLCANDPLLTPDKAAWLAPHWAARDAQGRWQILGDPAHRRVNPILYHVDEVLATWKCITAPVLWMQGNLTDTTQWWGHRYPRHEFEARLAVVSQVTRAELAPCGHMLHHDQPEALAGHLQRFLATR